MEFRDLKRQYAENKTKINEAMAGVLSEANYISGKQVTELETELAAYVDRKYCITCANGTDALQLALMAMNVGEGDAVFVPDFTFFATAEVVSLIGATPVFVDVAEDTFNICPDSLEKAIRMVLAEGVLCPRVVIPVDLFGLPANYSEIEKIADKYNLKILEDGAQGFGGRIGNQRACSFGNISTTSFFPAKPLGCYGDGGAIFTDDQDVAKVLRSLCVHGKGMDKYDNVRIGLNSRLDTIQAAILKVKLDVFKECELDRINEIADRYTNLLRDVVKVPVVPEGYYSSWAQYSILLENRQQREGLMGYLKEMGIPSMIYYKKPLHMQNAFNGDNSRMVECNVTENICDRILALPMHPYLEDDEVMKVAKIIRGFVSRLED